MKLEVGQEVKLNNGEVHEVRRENINGHFDIDGWWYTSEGIFLGEGKFYRLSVKRIIEEPDSKPQPISEGDMALRDWFAGKALANPAICKYNDEWPQKTAYAFADAMMAERKKGGAS